MSKFPKECSNHAGLTVSPAYPPCDPTVNTVPVPNALFLIILGLVALVATRRKK
jgi:hypothetical protein